MMISRPAPHTLINASIIILALFVFGLTGHIAWDIYSEYRSVRQMERANTIADDIITAAGIEALERGMTAAALGPRAHADKVTLQKIGELRRSGDEAWERASKLAHEFGRKNFTQNNNFDATLKQAVLAHQLLEKARLRVDNCIRINGCDIDGGEWIDAITNFIALAQRVWEVAFVSTETPTQIAQMNLSLKRWVWLASEHAGRERAALAYHISAGKPLPPAVMDELKSHRGVVDLSITDLRALKELPDTDARLIQAINVMEDAFLKSFEPVRRQAYAGAVTGDYRINGSHWMELATQAINSILTVSAAATQVSDEYARKVVRANTYYLVMVLLLTGVTSTLVVLALTRVRQTANELVHQKDMAEFTLHSIGDAVITTDAEARVKYLNPVAEKLTGWPGKDAEGRPLREIFNIVNGTTREPEANPVERCLQESRVIGLTTNTILKRRDGNEILIEDSAAPTRNYDGDIIGAVMVFYDVTMMRNSQHLLSHQATHDSLTGLINRREFERKMGHLLASARGTEQVHALCYLDLDQFKIINDTIGHAAGDNLLRQLSSLLQKRIRDTDTLARLGGDEFGMLLIGCPAERALQIAENLRQAIRDFRFDWNNQTFELSASLGLVPIAAESSNLAELMSKADAACFAAKEKGRNRVQVYQAGDIELAKRQGEMQWVSRITDALKENRLALYCQEIAPIGRADGSHWEILVRLLDEEGNLVPPMAFIPAAERYNLMPAVDRWIIANTLHAVGRRLEAHPHDRERQICSINLSGASVSDESMLAYIHEQMIRHRVPPACIGFEITETAAIANLGDAAAFIKALREQGCRFSLDDFGQGLSSFSYLKNLPVDYLKIDGAFVKDMLDDPINYATVQAINTVGHVIGIKTIAEYVESGAILEKLREVGVDYAQGYAIGHPRPLAECLAGN